MASREEWYDYLAYIEDHKKEKEVVIHHCSKCGHSQWTKEISKRGFIYWRCAKCKRSRWPRYAIKG